jgi:hypothetical protein
LILTSPSHAYVAGLDVADWDGDGRQDLIAGLTWQEPSETGYTVSRSQLWVYRQRPAN